MTEECDDSDDPTVIVEHPVPWRSQREWYYIRSSLLFNRTLFSGLSDFLASLDERYSQKVHKEGGLMAKKCRKTGSPASSLPPCDAPSWAVDPKYGRSLNV